MTQPSEADRVRSYIIAQANKLTIPQLVAKVRTDTAPLRDIAAQVPPEHFFDRPEETEWSSAEVFTHILAMNETGSAAIRGAIESGAMPAPIRDLMVAGTRPGLQTAEDYWQAYQSQREPLLSRVLEATGDEHLDAKITHSMFGAFSWREWLLFIRVHDLDHMRQLQTNASHFGSA